MKTTAALIIIFLSQLAAGQNVKQDLLICHVEPGVPQFRQKIVSYHFVNGIYTGKDELMQFDGKKDGRDYVRVDEGQNQFYRQQYLITGIGNIIDLKNKKIVFDGKANLVRISNDSAIYFTNDAFKGKYYSVFDFKNGRYSEVTNLLFKPRKGRDIEFDKKQQPFHLNYYPQNKPGVLLTKEAGYGQQNLPGQKYVPDPPIYWLEDTIFMFPAFSKDGTQLQIVKVKIESRNVQVLGALSVTALVEPTVFEKVDNETVVLHCGGSQIVINPIKNTFSTPAQSTPVKGFSYATTFDVKGRSIYQNGKEIGKLTFDLNKFRVTDNMAAVVKMMVVGNETYQQGLQVWNASSKTWQRIDTDEIAAIIGWVDLK